ncbi:MAG TPA: type VI secretion system ATPase TssH, partial [Candidatus Edwardsbacteria bacterium]|nr:type VI secretion system ATPase TssH [Candidatus Edwardsbacteria bacterium]
TSNIGSQWISELGGDEGKMRDKVMEAMRQHFRPEFLNRVDETIIFHRLDKAQITDIVDIQLKHLYQRLADRKIKLEVTEKAKGLLADEGFDPAFGARPLKRTIQRLLQDPLSMRILEGEFKEGDKISVDAKKGEIAFVKN